MTPVQSLKWVEDRMMPFYPLGDFKVSSAVAEIKV